MLQLYKTEVKAITFKIKKSLCEVSKGEIYYKMMFKFCGSKA